ncbi:MAG: hypothetical protein U9R53_06940 [Chloroflexota bacterium]|nr:hypothetical protein [Chloroflexota bacterium]
MLLSLWGRANFSRLYQELLNDPLSKKIIADVSYDFTQIAKSMGEYGGIAYLVRGQHFDDAV